MAMAKKLQREELVELVENVIHPKGKGFTLEEINQQLLQFCINCPDLVASMDIVINAPRGSTAEAVVSKALACPPRDRIAFPKANWPRVIRYVI
jgi:hypothetical protein